jgi:signal transduction histidine kinase
MLRSEITYPVDWFSTSIRWFILIGSAIALGITGELSFQILVLLFAAALWNLGLSILAASGRRLVWHAYIIITFDFILSGLLLLFTGSASWMMVWIGLLPISSAAYFFGVRGGIIASALTVLMQGAISILFINPGRIPADLGVFLLVYLVYGSALGYTARRFIASSTSARRARASSQQEAERAERERNRALYRLISALSATLNYERVLETAMDLGYSTLATINGNSETMVSAVLLFAQAEPKRTELHFGSARRFTRVEVRNTLPGVEGLIGRTIDEGQPQLGKSIAKDAELGRIVTLRSCQSAYCIPLRMGLDTYGVLLFAHPEDDFFTTERREILDIIGGQTVVAIQNARLYRDLELEKERIMDIQEEARRKLARDLHDGPTQSVAALAMRVNFARRLIEKDVTSAAEELYKIEDLARRTTKEIRHMLFTLRPLVLESQGLVAALQSMAVKMGETYNQKVQIEAEPDIVSQLEMNRQGVIFYIAEEAVNNARKHAQAAHVWIRLKQSGEELVLLDVEDDGVGFNSQEIDSDYSSRGSLGLVNMRERAELVNGVLSIDSVEGKGTRIRLLIPLSEEAAERIRHGLESI